VAKGERFLTTLKLRRRTSWPAHASSRVIRHSKCRKPHRGGWVSRARTASAYGSLSIGWRRPRIILRAINAGCAAVALAGVEHLAMAAQGVARGAYQVVAQPDNFVILVAVIAQNLLGELAHVAGDHKRLTLRVAAHLFDRRLDVVAAAFVFRVLAEHRCTATAVNVGERNAAAFFMSVSVMRKCHWYP